VSRAEALRQFLAGEVEADHVDVRARGTRERRRKQPDAARAPDEYLPARSRLSGQHRAQRVAARLHEGPGAVVHRTGEAVEAADGNEELLGEGTRPAGDADLAPVGAHVMTPGRAAAAATAAEHGVAGDARADPALVGLRPDGGHGAAPLVTRAQREARLSLLEIGQFPGEKLDIGATDSYLVHIDHHLAGAGNRHGDALNAGRLGAVDNQGAHQAGHRGPSVIIQLLFPSRSG
jgi:hypothetical protein